MTNPRIYLNFNFGRNSFSLEMFKVKQIVWRPNLSSAPTICFQLSTHLILSCNKIIKIMLEKYLIEIMGKLGISKEKNKNKSSCT